MRKINDVLKSIGDRGITEEKEKEIKKLLGISDNGLFFPEDGQTFFYIDVDGSIECTRYSKSSGMDEFLIATGNCYKTKEEAEKAREILLATQRLKVEIARLNEGWKPNWEDKDERKYYLVYDWLGEEVDAKYYPEYDLSKEELSWNFCRHYKSIDDSFYLKSEKLCEQLIKTHESDLKILLGVE